MQNNLLIYSIILLLTKFMYKNDNDIKQDIVNFLKDS